MGKSMGKPWENPSENPSENLGKPSENPSENPLENPWENLGKIWKIGGNPMNFMGKVAMGRLVSVFFHPFFVV